MAEFDYEKDLESINKKKYAEEYDRLTAVSNIKVEHFSKHQKIEGYIEDRDMSRFFGCDRLMKIENLYGRLQMGYNPNRERSFIFANIKTSRYDTVSSRYQKELKEYQMKTLLKGQNQNRAYVSKQFTQTSVLLEKAEAKPWTEQSIKPYYGKVNMESLRKTMPFFAKQDEMQELRKIKEKQKEIKVEVAMNSREGKHSDNTELHAKAMEKLQQENLLQALIIRKDAGSRFFLRKINYAFDIQKHEMFEYYKNKREENEKAAESINEASEDGDEKDKK